MCYKLQNKLCFQTGPHFIQKHTFRFRHTNLSFSIYSIFSRTLQIEDMSSMWQLTTHNYIQLLDTNTYNYIQLLKLSYTSGSESKANSISKFINSSLHSTAWILVKGNIFSTCFNHETVNFLSVINPSMLVRLPAKTCLCLKQIIEN